MSISGFSSAIVAAALAALVLLLPQEAAAGGFHGASFSVSPSLTPAFTQEVHDYVTTCPNGRVTVNANAPSGVVVKIHSLAAASGRQSVRLALGPGQRIIVRIRAGKAVSEYSFRCLPPDFPTLSASGSLSAEVPFFAFSMWDLSGASRWPYAVIADRLGTPVWWLRYPDPGAFGIEPAGRGRVAIWSGSLVGGVGVGSFKLFSYSGKRLGVVRMAGNHTTDAHEILRTSRGTTFLASYVPRDHVDLTSFGGRADGTVMDTLVHEIDAAGRLVWSWNSKDHIALAETGRWWNLMRGNGATPDTTGYDITHFNSLEEDGKGGLIMSFRHLDAVYRIRKSDGKIDWKLGGTRTSRSLNVYAGDDDYVGHHLGAQHDARLQPDGSITVFDNQSFIGPPRLTRWVVNANSRTAVLVEKMQDPAIDGSICCGSSRRLRDGSWLVSWGGRPDIRGYNSRHSKIFSLGLPVGSLSYRAVPLRSGEVTREELVAGMSAMHPR